MVYTSLAGVALSAPKRAVAVTACQGNDINKKGKRECTQPLLSSLNPLTLLTIKYKFFLMTITSPNSYTNSAVERVLSEIANGRRLSIPLLYKPYNINNKN